MILNTKSANEICVCVCMYVIILKFLYYDIY